MEIHLLLGQYLKIVMLQELMEIRLIIQQVLLVRFMYLHAQELYGYKKLISKLLILMLMTDLENQ